MDFSYEGDARECSRCGQLIESGDIAVEEGEDEIVHEDCA
jgi:hypothetical protein